MITFLAGFWIGVGFNRAARHRKGAFILNAFVTILAIASSIVGLFGIIQFASLGLFMAIAGKFPSDIQSLLFFDLLMAGTRLWIFAIVAAVLWWVRGKI